MTFVESSLAKAAGARSTARFDVRVIYERKIDVAAERERLTKELTKLTQELTRANGAVEQRSVPCEGPANVVEGLKKRKGEVEVLVEKAKAALRTGCIGVLDEGELRVERQVRDCIRGGQR